MVDGASLRVLVVDDHVGFRTLARLLLTAGGFVVVGEAGTGAEALSCSALLRPDAVLLDVQLPDLTRFAASARRRERSDSPAVVLTSARPLSDYGARVM